MAIRTIDKNRLSALEYIQEELAKSLAAEKNLEAIYMNGDREKLSTYLFMSRMATHEAKVTFFHELISLLRSETTLASIIPTSSTLAIGSATSTPPSRLQQKPLGLSQ